MLHEAVAANPLVATWCFHWTVKLVIRTLFNCDVLRGDSINVSKVTLETVDILPVMDVEKHWLRWIFRFFLEKDAQE